MHPLDQYITDLENTLAAIDRSAFDAMVDELKRVHAEDRCLFVAGNGGSAATASHIVNDFIKGAAWPAKGKTPHARPLRVVGLADCVPLMTAFANDNDYAFMFTAQLQSLGREGDALLAISGSGNSPNIVGVANAARSRGIKVIGMTGFDGGELGQIADVHVHVPCDSMPRAEDAHLILQHACVEVLKAALTAT
jgi:D-sedoheptulose 7-phosphate isomerase